MSDRDLSATAGRLIGGIVVVFYSTGLIAGMSYYVIDTLLHPLRGLGL